MYGVQVSILSDTIHRVWRIQKVNMDSHRARKVVNSFHLMLEYQISSLILNGIIPDPT